MRSRADILDSLELNIHQLVLSDLAENIGQSKGGIHDEAFDVSIDLVTSQVETRVISGEGREEENAETPERVFMVCFSLLCKRFSAHSSQSYSRVQCNIGFAELAVSLPHAHVDETVPVLVDILRDIPYIDFDRCLAWDGACVRVSVEAATIQLSQFYSMVSA